MERFKRKRKIDDFFPPASVPPSKAKLADVRGIPSTTEPQGQAKPVPTNKTSIFECTPVLQRIFHYITCFQDIARCELVCKTFKKFCWIGIDDLSVGDRSVHPFLEMSKEQMPEYLRIIWKKSTNLKRLSGFMEENWIVEILEELSRRFRRKLETINWECRLRMASLPQLVHSNRSNLRKFVYQHEIEMEPSLAEANQLVDFDEKLWGKVSRCKKLEFFVFRVADKVVDSELFDYWKLTGFVPMIQKLKRLKNLELEADHGNCCNVPLFDILGALQSQPGRETGFQLWINMINSFEEDCDQKFNFVTDIVMGSQFGYTYVPGEDFKPEIFASCFPNLSTLTVGLWRAMHGPAGRKVSELLNVFADLPGKHREIKVLLLRDFINDDDTGIVDNGEKIMRSVYINAGVFGEIMITDALKARICSNGVFKEDRFHENFYMRFCKGNVTVLLRDEKI